MSVPAATPVRTPVVALIVAIAALLPFHVPPEVVLANVVTALTQTVELPDIAAGAANTVTTAVCKQPEGI